MQNEYLETFNEELQKNSISNKIISSSTKVGEERIAMRSQCIQISAIRDLRQHSYGEIYESALSSFLSSLIFPGKQSKEWQMKCSIKKFQQNPRFSGCWWAPSATDPWHRRGRWRESIRHEKKVSTFTQLESERSRRREHLSNVRLTGAFSRLGICAMEDNCWYLSLSVHRRSRQHRRRKTTTPTESDGMISGPFGLL